MFGTNDNSSASFFAIDTAGPVVDSSVSPDAVNDYRLPGAIVSVVAIDPFGSGVDYIEHCFDATGSECDAFGSGVWLATAGDAVDVVVNTTTTVRYRVFDIVGNLGSEGTPRLVQIDDTPPATTVTPSGTPTNGWYGLDDLVDTDTDGACTDTSTSCALRLDFAAKDSESGVESISYSTDGGTTYTVTPGAAAQLDLFASATVLFYGTDNLGNFPTEAGTFNPDPDSESFQIDAIAPTVTIIAAGRALDPAYTEENLPLLRAGMANLKAHIENALRFGVPVVVAVNMFPTDTEHEVRLINETAIEAGAVDAVMTDHWARGGEGAKDLAKAVTKACEEPSDFRFLYPLERSIKEKIETIVTQIYSAGYVEYSPLANRQIAEFEKAGFGYLPICMAKTHLSISHDPALKGAPSGFTLPVREVRASVGAGFICPILGQMRTMPGLGTTPAFMNVDINDAGEVVGLF